MAFISNTARSKEPFYGSETKKGASTIVSTPEHRKDLTFLEPAATYSSVS